MGGGGGGGGGSHDTAVWPLVLIRIYIASGYTSSGLCKFLSSIRFGRFWGCGTTLQMYVFDSMWSRPAPPSIRQLQWLLLQRPLLLSLFATAALCFETFFCFAPFSPTLGVLFGLKGLGFHMGIYALQGLDFVSWWMPALLAFLVGSPLSSALCGGATLDAPLSAYLSAGLQLAPHLFYPAAAYVTLQLLTALSFYDLWLDDVLPFSCCPMFMPPRSLYDSLPKFWTMTDAPLQGSTRLPGSMEPLYWSPCSCVFAMPQATSPYPSTADPYTPLIHTHLTPTCRPPPSQQPTPAVVRGLGGWAPRPNFNYLFSYSGGV